MNKNHKEIQKSRIISFIRESDQTNQAARLLKDAWSNLPPDVSFEERFIFLEITQRILEQSNFSDDFQGKKIIN